MVWRPSGSRSRGDEAARLVKQEEPRFCPRGERGAVDRDFVGVGDIDGGTGQHLAIQCDTAFADPDLGVAARAGAGPGDDLGDALRRVGSVFAVGFCARGFARVGGEGREFFPRQAGFLPRRAEFLDRRASRRAA